MIKLIALFIVILIIAVIVWTVTPEYDKCYSDKEYEGYASMGCCKGLTGGTKSTDYLSETCCSCPYLVLGCDRIRKEEKRMNENKIIEMLGDIRYEMFDILEGDALSKVLLIIDKKMDLYRGKSNEDIAKELIKND